MPRDTTRRSLLGFPYLVGSTETARSSRPSPVEEEKASEVIGGRNDLDYLYLFDKVGNNPWDNYEKSLDGEKD